MVQWLPQSVTVTFEEMENKMDERFEEMENKLDEQFEEMENKMDEQFEEMENKRDERFEEMENKLDEQFEEMENKMGERFEDMENKLDEQFEEIENNIDKQFEKVDEQLFEVQSELRDVTIELANAKAITRNGRLRRMHQPINLIKVFRPIAGSNKFAWQSHPKVPKHMKGVFYLGQRAKGEFETKLSNAQKTQAKREALRTLRELAEFYQVAVYPDHQSESEATEKITAKWSVDDYMEALLDEWGMDWQKVLRLGKQVLQPQQSRAGAKRAANASTSDG
ncbi:hypothetical protein PRK78_001767 [Emydomyces testavorans]|uniref:Uncharacterized protein n=1 Tax=Emydomyces testavorans TaxID=2070801 RepID=A0AAF0IJ01_9EURO|nr:hypothetical protein PRK78_001767 [Emydomyces testavorans]